MKEYVAWYTQQLLVLAIRKENTPRPFSLMTGLPVESWQWWWWSCCRPLVALLMGDAGMSALFCVRY